MGKTCIIAGREFNERVKKRSFLVTTLIVPLLYLGLLGVSSFVAKESAEEIRLVTVIDRSGIVAPRLPSEGSVYYLESDEKEEKNVLEKCGPGWDVLVIGKDVLSNPEAVKLYTHSMIPYSVESAIARDVAQAVETEKLRSHQIENLPQILEEVKTDIRIRTFQITPDGEKARRPGILSHGTAFLFGMLMYFFVMLYGAQVMSGVAEEKSNKVIEVIVSSVKPAQLMIGKILGIGAAAIVQFLIWILFIGVATGALLLFVDPATLGKIAAQNGLMPLSTLPNAELGELLAPFADWDYLAGLGIGFLLFFVGGYLLYAAMYAAVGSAVSNMQDLQQLQLPVTIPLIAGFIAMIAALSNPEGPVAFWFGLIPFTSPIVMAARLPYGIPLWEITLSLVLLYGTFIAMVIVAARIYRVGIFMQGRRPSFAEIAKWITYK